MVPGPALSHDPFAQDHKGQRTQPGRIHPFRRRLGAAAALDHGPGSLSNGLHNPTRKRRRLEISSATPPYYPCLVSRRDPARDATGTISLIYGSGPCPAGKSVSTLASPAIRSASWRSYSRDITARSSICSCDCQNAWPETRRDGDGRTRVRGTPTMR